VHKGQRRPLEVGNDMMEDGSLNLTLKRGISSYQAGVRGRRHSLKDRRVDVNTHMLYIILTFFFLCKHITHLTVQQEKHIIQPNIEGILRPLTRLAQSWCTSQGLVN
jgi:hypothetical protein